MSVIDYFIPHAQQDTVAVFDQTFTQVFPQARILKPIVKESAKGMEHPIETGVVITDHVIINPNEIELPMIVKSPNLKDVYKVIKNYFLESTLLVIQTKTDIYSNMYILEMPHEEDPNQFDAVTIAVLFKQALIVTSQSSSTIAPVNPSNSSNVNTGTQQPIAPPSSTILIDIFGGLFPS